jgi:ferredoxin--NADP+ reductase
MFEIARKQLVADNVKRLDIYAPNISQKARPGQFVSIAPEEGDERIPLSVIDTDTDKGTISIIFQEVGQTTGKLGTLPINESVFSILGPLGVPARVKKWGNAICIATGIGIAKVLPICRAYREAGNKVIGIIGARSKKDLLLEPQMRLSCDKIYIATEDGSYERKGLATDIFERVLHDRDIHYVYAVGSVDMMKTVCRLTRNRKIKTAVQLNPVMVDCMGMCGSCRVKVDGQTVFACTDGPEFDGHKVDFDDFKKRKRSIEECDQCHNQKLPHKRQRNGLGILTRLFSGFQKD